MAPGPLFHCPCFWIYKDNCVIVNKESNYLITVLQWRNLRRTKKTNCSYTMYEYMNGYKHASKISYNLISQTFTKKGCLNNQLDIASLHVPIQLYALMFLHHFLTVGSENNSIAILKCVQISNFTKYLHQMLAINVLDKQVDIFKYLKTRH